MYVPCQARGNNGATGAIRSAEAAARGVRLGLAEAADEGVYGLVRVAGKYRQRASDAHHRFRKRLVERDNPILA